METSTKNVTIKILHNAYKHYKENHRVPMANSWINYFRNESRQSSRYNLSLSKNENMFKKQQQQSKTKKTTTKKSFPLRTPDYSRAWSTRYLLRHAK